MGDFLKKYPADQVKTDFEGKKILARKYLAKKIPTLKKYSSWPVAHTKFYHQRLGAKYS